MNKNPFSFTYYIHVLGFLTVLLIFHAVPQLARAQSLDLERGRSRQMLDNIRGELKKHYYDSTFHGVDLDARFKVAEEKLKQATSLGQMFGVIAQAIIELEDSHTFFLPPSRVMRVDYGWQMQMVGDNCYVIAVKPGSDAEAKGLKVGDRVIEVDGYQLTRDNLWKFDYLYYALRPQPGMRVTAQSPGGEPRRLDVAAKVQQGKREMDLASGADFGILIREAETEARLTRQRYYETNDLVVWKMPQFDLEEGKVDEIMDKVKKRKALILDLRGNPGGYVKMLERLVGHFFDQDMKIADLKGRKEMKPIVAKTRGHAFVGKVIVLVDSRSGSAAELFARLMQLEKRGTVIGDRTAGAVMQSRTHGLSMGVETVLLYGMSITNADVIMSDGKSLERVGVTPDEAILPTAEDLAAKRDPVLSHAASLVGVKLDAEKAGAMFPIEWRK